MRRKIEISPEIAFPAVAVTVVALLGVIFALSAIARPENFDQRIEVVRQQIVQARALASQPGDLAAYSREATCSAPTDQAATALRQRLQAAGAGLSDMSIQVTPHGPDPEHGMSGVDLKVESVGQYDLIIAMLGRLASEQPDIFIDTLDLQPRVSAVALKLNGHVLCLASAASAS